jgi:hypothetical protein
VTINIPVNPKLQMKTLPTTTTPINPPYTYISISTIIVQTGDCLRSSPSNCTTCNTIKYRQRKRCKLSYHVCDSFQRLSILARQQSHHIIRRLNNIFIQNLNTVANPLSRENEIEPIKQGLNVSIH